MKRLGLGWLCVFGWKLGFYLGIFIHERFGSLGRFKEQLDPVRLQVAVALIHSYLPELLALLPLALSVAWLAKSDT